MNLKEKVLQKLKDKNEVKKLLTGKPLFKESVDKVPEEELFSIFFEERFIGIYRQVNEVGIIARPQFVRN